MPELPDVVTYLESLAPRIEGQVLHQVRLANPFLLRSVDPPLDAVHGLRVRSLGRMGKRLVIGFEDDLFLVLHLMIAGRLRWENPGAPVPRRLGLGAFDFDPGTLVLTEAGTKKRASLHVVRGEQGLAAFDRGGLEILETDVDVFRETITRNNHTLKRALTDPRILSGIGNAYSDEILHRAGLSPLRWTSRLENDEIQRLFDAARAVLTEWTERLRRQYGGSFPTKVTAFRPEMAVHGQYKKPCPVCGAPVQRIVYSKNECNYCPRCQTGGKILADRALSRLLKNDWPRNLEELEERRPKPDGTKGGGSSESA